IVAGGIDELVRHAANLQSEHIVEAREARQGYKAERKTVPKTYLGPGNELATVLSEMEKAAADARLPTPEQRSEASKPEVLARKPMRQPDTFANLPDIEVWKKEPDVIIYRRKSGKLTRVKGD
ncbi:MAG: hypothetical protein HOH26_14470, partial [Alphaproteobacteria bacterium]|nr:hypothetical protein [Alphaproteobacteria bacterium]